METKYQQLFKPFKVGNLEIKNRFFVASMGGNDQVDDVHGLGDKTKRYYLERAKGGFGVLATGTITIRWHEDRYIVEEQFLTEKVDKPMFILNAKDFIRDVHAYGAKMMAQISIGTTPCQFPGTFSPSVACNDITKEEIKYYVKRYGEAAKLFKDAGFDMVEVHSVHTGYILDQFCNAETNQRTDEYGGSLENRARIVVEVLEAIRETCGPDYPISLKIGGTSEIYDMHADGSMKIFRRGIDETVELCKIFAKAGYDMLNVDGCRNNSIYTDQTTNLEYWKKIKEAVDIPVIASGSMANPDLNIEMLENGYCDAFALGRQSLCDPYYPNKLKANKFDDIRYCMRCNGACIASSLYGYPVTCVANPRAGMDAETYLYPAEEKKEVFVIGAGVGGMEAALTASKRGHDVSLFEKTGEMGGLFLAASAFDFKEPDKKLIDWYVNQIKKSNVKVFLNTEVDKAFVEEHNPDVVICATGANEVRVPVPGHDKSHVVMLTETARKKVAVGENVAIIGGGLSGCELGAQLLTEGKKVTVVEMLPKLMAAKKDPVAMSTNPLIARLNNGGANIMTSTKLKAIEDDKIIVERDGVDIEVEADTVVMSVGFRPENSLYKSLENYAGEVYIIGDAAGVADVLNAIWGGYNLGKGI